jgi:TolB protein
VSKKRKFNMCTRHFVAVLGTLVLFAQPVRDARLSADKPDESAVSTILFTSTRDSSPTTPPINGGEIYAMDFLPGGSVSPARRLTTNFSADIFPALAPDGSGRIVFDSSRLRSATDPVNVSDLFLMNPDGTGQVFLTRGGSPTWSPPRGTSKGSRMIAFHASASGLGRPINPFPGSATADSDIWVVNVDRLLEHGAQPRNLTPNRVATVDDDPSWSPDGKRIAFTSYINDPSTTLTSAEIFVMSARGKDQVQLTDDGVEKRGPAWSPDGRRLLFACRMGPIAANGIATFELCVMNAVVSAEITRLTINLVNDLTPTWSPDGQEIVFHKTPLNQLFTMHADGSGERPLTAPPGLSLLATSWGLINPERRVP